jgi:hypothetical protein
VRQTANDLGVDTSLAGKEPNFLRRVTGDGEGRPRRRRTEADRERARRAYRALRADPERHAAYLERQRKRHRERWRTDPEFRRARVEALYRWRRKRREQQEGT